ncbi:hypothetical protein [Halobellus litoreus]|uniref:Uncharacterized protein n=1 Tax=Halobellus litoreus TaxID=755310 RepID=A0ABD6E0U2_9EURY|nr:hypothetical protein [Halobellus litoreus]
MTNLDDERTNRPRTTEPDASGSWRDEYAAQAVDAELRADGGTAYRLPEEGEVVRDRDSDAGDTLVVVDTHPETTAASFAIDAIGATVAEANPEYDDGAPVVEAAYVEDVNDTLPDWYKTEDLRDAVSFGALSTYTFPADRLAPYNGGERR